jgi:hypothetical protein
MRPSFVQRQKILLVSGIGYRTASKWVNKPICQCLLLIISTVIRLITPIL